MSRLSLPTLIIAGLVVAILLTFMCTYQVNFYEVAVKVRLGQADEDSVIWEPGLKAKWPRPIERVVKYDTRLRTLDTPETEIKTIDGKNVIVGSYAVWKVAKPLRFYNRARTIETAESQMRSRISQAQAAVIGKSRLSDFVNLDRTRVDENYRTLFASLRDAVHDKLLTDYGIEVTQIGIRRISLPKETTQQVFESMRQERNRLATEYREEGKSEAQAIVARAEAEAKAIQAFANRLAQEIKSAGVQAATNIFQRIEAQDREFFEWLRWLDALKAALAQETTIFLDQHWPRPMYDAFTNPPVGADDRP